MTTSHLNAMAKLKTSRAGRVVWWFWPLLCLVGLLLLSIGVLVFGYVNGTEVSKQDLTIRTFSYRQLPILKWQIGGVLHEFPSCAATDVAIATHLKPLQKGQKAEWDLVEFEEFGSAKVQGDAAILSKILNQRSDTLSFYWVDWSTQHPIRAAELWPVVQDLAHCNMYWAIPPLMEIYNSGTKDNSLIPERNESIIASAKLALKEAEARQDTAAIAMIHSRLAAYDEFSELKKVVPESETSKSDKPSEPTSSP